MSLSISTARANQFGIRMGIAPHANVRASRRGRAGDPGFFGFLGDAVSTIGKGVFGAAGGLLSGGPIGALAGGLSGLGILKGATPATVSAIPNISPAGIAGGALVGTDPKNCAGLFLGGKCIGGSWGGGSAQVGVTPLGPMDVGTGGFTPGQVSMNGKKRRRMNPLNPRALSRSMRRVASFSRATRSIEKELGKLGRAHGPRRAPACRPKGRGAASCSCK